MQGQAGGAGFGVFGVGFRAFAPNRCPLQELEHAQELVLRKTDSVREAQESAASAEAATHAAQEEAQKTELELKS